MSNAARHSPSAPTIRRTMPKEASQTSQSAARTAVRLGAPSAIAAEVLVEALGKCTPSSAPNAAMTPPCPSSHGETAPSIAATASGGRGRRFPQADTRTCARPPFRAANIPRVGPTFSSPTPLPSGAGRARQVGHAEDSVREVEESDGTAPPSPAHFISSKTGRRAALASDCSSVSSAS